MKLNKGIKLFTEHQCLVEDLVKITDSITGYTNKLICKRIAKIRKKLKLKE